MSVCVISLPQSQVAEKGRELKELKDTLALVVKEKEKLEGVGDSFHFLFYRPLPLERFHSSITCFSSSVFPLPFWSVLNMPLIAQVK